MLLVHIQMRLKQRTRRMMVSSLLVVSYPKIGFLLEIVLKTALCRIYLEILRKEILSVSSRRFSFTSLRKIKNYNWKPTV